MSYIKRIEQYLLSPMLIEPRLGLEAFFAYMNNTHSTENANSLPLEYYRQTIKASEPELFQVNSSGSFVANNSNDLNSENRTIARLKLRGTMLADGGLCTRGIEDLCRDVEACAANPNIIGVVLDTRSGGGQVVAAQMLSNSLTELQAMKPVVQYVAGYAASGAYWAGAHCDEIIAGGNTVEVGSIGVVIQFDAEALADFKEKVISVYADGSEEKHDIVKAILNGDHDYVKSNALNPIKREFDTVVKRGRSKIKDEALTGKMYFSKDAKKIGLIDQIGSINLAMNRVVTLSRRKNRTRNAKNALNYAFN